MSHELSANKMMDACNLLGEQLCRFASLEKSETERKKVLILNINATCWLLGIEPPDLDGCVS